MTVTEAHAILRKDRPNITMEQVEVELLGFQSLVRLRIDRFAREVAAIKAQHHQYDPEQNHTSAAAQPA